jgi:hypothetical protein
MVTVAHDLCTICAAVTIALLDSATRAGSEYSFAEKLLLNFFTRQKNLCYYAALIGLQKIFYFGQPRTVNRALSAVNLMFPATP